MSAFLKFFHTIQNPYHFSSLTTTKENKLGDVAQFRCIPSSATSATFVKIGGSASSAGAIS